MKTVCGVLRLLVACCVLVQVAASAQARRPVDAATQHAVGQRRAAASRPLPGAPVGAIDGSGEGADAPAVTRPPETVASARDAPQPRAGGGPLGAPIGTPRPRTPRPGTEEAIAQGAIRGTQTGAPAQAVAPSRAGGASSGAPAGAPRSEAEGAAAREVARQPETAVSGSTSGASPNLPVCSLSRIDPNKLAVEPCRPAPPRPGRRAVPQVLSTMPVQSRARQPADAPPSVTVAPGTPQAAASRPPSQPSPTPSAIIGCDSGGCRDAGGARYNGGVGNAVIDRNGKLCTRDGAFLRCP